MTEFVLGAIAALPPYESLYLSSLCEKLASSISGDRGTCHSRDIDKLILLLHIPVRSISDGRS